VISTNSDAKNAKKSDFSIQIKKAEKAIIHLFCISYFAFSNSKEMQNKCISFKFESI
jgi:hypothetical protein